jgi:arylsulfatase
MMKSSVLLMLFISGFLCVSAGAAEQKSRPNIIVFMTDDAGYSDISLFGSEIKTPHIDQLADTGVVFRKFYNNARCSPTRASLLTGLYPHTVGVGDLCGEGYATALPGYTGYLNNNNNATIAELLKSAGYVTMLSGKWHLGGELDFPDSFGSHPLRRGFDKFYGMLGPSADYFTPQCYWDGFEPAEPPASGDQWYSEDAFGDKAVEWIEDAVSEDKPFFLYLAFKAPHNPRQALDADYKPYVPVYAKKNWPSIMANRVAKLKEFGIIPKEWGANTFEFDPAYYESMPEDRAQTLQEIAAIKAGAIVSADRNVGKVMDALDRLSQRNNTLVMFFSDNGSALAHDLNNLWDTPFRGGKGDLTEGGTASPCIVQWPDVIKKYRFVTDAAGILDVMPTALEAAGVEYPSQYQGRQLCPLEGESLLPLFKGQDASSLNNRPLFWELYGQKSLVWKNRWKYYQSYDMQTGDREEFLFDLNKDGAELNNLIDSPQAVELIDSLRADWQKWAGRVGAEEFESVMSARKKFHEKPVQPAASSRLINGSFEEGPAGKLIPPGLSEDVVPGWRAFDTTGRNRVQLMNDPAGAADGNKYMEIISTVSGNDAGDTGVDVTTAGAGASSLSVGKTYVVSFEARHVSGPDNSLHVSVCAKDGTQDVGPKFAGESVALTPEWKSYSYSFTVTGEHLTSAGGAPLFYIGFRPKADGALQRETIRIDHVNLSVQ